MANITITQLPSAGAITGTELVPIVQNGVTVQTTTGAIAVQPTQTQTFLTATQQPSLANSRYLAAGSGLSLTDGGSQGTLQINLTGAASSLNSAGTGIQVKTGANTVTARQLTVGTGLSVTNGDGVSANPTVSLGSFLANINSLSGSSGLVGLNSGTASTLSISGTSNQIVVANGNGASGSPTISIASNPIFPGTGSVTVPVGTTAQQLGSSGAIRFNSDTGLFEGYGVSGWNQFTTGGSGVTSVGTGTGLTGGPITSTGTISIANTTVTSGSYGSASAVGTFTVNGQGQLTAASSTTISIPSSAINTAIQNSGLANSSLTVGTTTISLGGTSLTLAGLTSVAVTQDPASALQLATKQYVDNVAQGLDAKASCVYGTTNNITLSGLATQSGGDWPSSLTAGNRILVKNQSSSQFNGIYVASASAWTRATDMDTWAEVPSSFVFIEDGTTLADTGWVTTANAGGTIDVTAMPWVQFSGAGAYTAGTGLTLTGSQFSLTSPVTAALGGSGYTSYTTGDMLYASGSTALSKLGIGTSGYLLTSSGSAPQWTQTLGVANGGTGVTASSGANSVVLRDASGNITTNSIFEGYSNVAAAGTTTVLTVASVPNYVVTGSGGQTYQLPDATTLPNGADFTFNNNQSSGTIVVKNNSSTTVVTVQSGAFVTVSLLSNSTAAGSWDYHANIPSGTSWSTNTLSTGAAITSTQAVTGSTLISNVATGTAPLTVTSTTQVANLNAATAGTATNIAGGAIGYLPYQSAAGTTLFVTGNTTTTPQFLTSTGTGSAAQAPTLTSSTGSGSVVLATSPTLVTPNLGTPSTLVGTNITGTASGLSIGGNAATATTATTATTANATNTSNNFQMNSLGVGTAGSGTAGEIRATNNVTAYYSDDRLKTRLGYIQDALAKVKTLSGFYYEANQTAQDLGYEPVREVGVSAQQVQAVMPEIVVPAPISDKYLTVRYEKLIPLLIEAVKELDAKLETLIEG